MSTPDPHWVTVVGVSKNAKQVAWTETAQNEIYLSYHQDPNYARGVGPMTGSLTFVVRTAGDPAAIAAVARDAIWSIDRNVAISELQTMDAVVAHATAEPRFHLVLLVAFAAVALALAAVGIYGVMSYAVSRRSHEIGIRMALGARQGDVLRLVVSQGMTLAIVGGAAGLLGAFALTRLMARLLYGVGATDPITFGAVALVLFTVALLACYLPARRAARIDPMVALRSE